MRIIIRDQEFTCENDIMVVEQVFERISQLLTEKDQMIVCLEIDGVEVYDEFGQYIADHLRDLEVILVNAKTQQELLADTLTSVREYVTRAIPEIDKLVDELYHEVTSDTWNTFTHLIEGLQFITESLDAVVQHEDWYFNAKQFALAKENLANKINMLHEAAVSQDRVWLSDVLLYEIIPAFRSLSMTIEASHDSVHVH